MKPPVIRSEGIYSHRFWEGQLVLGDEYDGYSERIERTIQKIRGLIEDINEKRIFIRVRDRNNLRYELYKISLTLGIWETREKYFPYAGIYRLEANRIHPKENPDGSVVWSNQTLIESMAERKEGIVVIMLNEEGVRELNEISRWLEEVGKV